MAVGIVNFTFLNNLQTVLDNTSKMHNYCTGHLLLYKVGNRLYSLDYTRVFACVSVSIHCTILKYLHVCTRVNIQNDTYISKGMYVCNSYIYIPFTDCKLRITFIVSKVPFPEKV
uniref:Uncharacterized protein n=1 Tax=Cacopsylla melanoneura TaxID=428564 RepID=A0A8D8QYP0_9HEMI